MINLSKIVFSKPVRLKNHMDFFELAFEGQFSGNGPYTKKCEEWFHSYFNTKTLLTTSATHALETMAFLINIKPGDEVIVPSFTFVSTANAFVIRGAIIKFVDCDLKGNICLNDLQRLIGPKTKAIVVVHYGGNSCDLDLLINIIKDTSIVLLEDSAQAIAGYYKKKRLGLFGELSCLSFHETKNISSGEGGALIINNPIYIERAEIIREKGTNRTKFLHGLVDKYTWVDVGSSYILSDINACYLFPQLLQLNEIQEKRKQIWDQYYSELEKIIIDFGCFIITPNDYNTPNYHMFSFVFKKLEQRSCFIEFMKNLNISTPFHFVSLHKSPFGSKFWDNKELPCTDLLSDGLVRLPLYYNMNEVELNIVIEAVKKWFKNQQKSKVLNKEINNSSVLS